MLGQPPMIMVMGEMIISDMFGMMVYYEKLWQVGELQSAVGLAS